MGDVTPIIDRRQSSEPTLLCEHCGSDDLSAVGVNEHGAVRVCYQCSHMTRVGLYVYPQQAA